MLVKVTLPDDICKNCSAFNREFEIAAQSSLFPEGPDKKDGVKLTDADRMYGQVDVTQNKNLFSRLRPPKGRYPFVLFFSGYGKHFVKYSGKL
jgi:hypothetical protein